MMQPILSGARPREPAINLPPLLVGLILLLLAIQGVREFLPEETDLRVLVDGSFIPAPWSIALGRADVDAVVAAAGAGHDTAAAAGQAALARYVAEQVPAHPWSVVTYALLHGSWLHVVINTAWLAAFGAPVMRRAGAVRACLLAVLTAVGGALAQWIASPLGIAPMVGASAVASGFMAAAATFVFSRPGGASRADGDAQNRSRWEFLGQRGALVFLGVWFASNAIFGVLAEPMGLADGAVAWEAHIGGLLVGLLVFPLLDPLRSRRGAMRA